MPPADVRAAGATLAQRQGDVGPGAPYGAQALPRAGLERPGGGAVERRPQHGRARPHEELHGGAVGAEVDQDGTTIVFDTTTWQPIQVIERSDHGGVIAARFSHDGTVLVTLGVDGTIAVRGPATWAFRRLLAAGTSATDNLDQGCTPAPTGSTC
jgi:hypothetical protein